MDSLDRFRNNLILKMRLLQDQPFIGFKTKKYSRFRKVLIARHHMLIYSVSPQHIVVHHLKHVRLQ